MGENVPGTRQAISHSQMATSLHAMFDVTLKSRGYCRLDVSRAAGTGTPRDGGAAPPAGRSAGSATPSRKSTSKTPSEQLRSGSAVKRKFAPVGGRLAPSPGSVRPRAAAARTASGLHVRFHPFLIKGSPPLGFATNTELTPFPTQGEIPPLGLVTSTNDGGSNGGSL